jgi:hypothetical protein
MQGHPEVPEGRLRRGLFVFLVLVLIVVIFVFVIIFVEIVFIFLVVEVFQIFVVLVLIFFLIQIVEGLEALQCRKSCDEVGIAFGVRGGYKGHFSLLCLSMYMAHGRAGLFAELDAAESTWGMW